MNLLLRILRKSAYIICSLAFATAAWGQSDEIARQFRQVTPEEDKKLRAILAEPIPEGLTIEGLRLHFGEKNAASFRLNEQGQREAVLREAVKRLPDAGLRSDLARQLMGRGQVEEANALMQQAAASANPYAATFILARIACDLINQNKHAAARKAIAENLQRVNALRTQAKQSWQKLELERAQYRNFLCLSLLEDSLGKYPASVTAAIESEKYARIALPLGMMSESPTSRGFVQESLAISLGRKVYALRAAGRHGEAEVALSDYMRISNELELPAGTLASIYNLAARIRFSQREFAQAETLSAKADAALEKLGYSGIAAGRANIANTLSAVMAAQKKWPQALALYERLDVLAGDDVHTKSLIKYPFGRALANLGNARYAQSAELFRVSASDSEKAYGENHFFTVQSRGLQGVALWRMGTTEGRAQAVPLLKAAVRGYMSAANADYLENTGSRKERREDVFSTYLEAMAVTPEENAVEAMGPADWVRSGSVQDALNDAAVRAAANTPAMVDVVRLEQDAKNEIAGLRRFLSGDAGGNALQLPGVAAQMRTRIALLETERIKYQREIKAKFPDYDRLVRPSMPNAQDIAQQLDASQALLMVLPTTDAVYVWAVARDKPAAFSRVAMPETEINELVKRLRNNLDFANIKGAPTQFDNVAAYTLYQKLIAPVSTTLQDKTQWIVATGGALSQLPFAVLQTQPGVGSGQEITWLIKKIGITQVPSLSAWLALKSIAKNKPATHAFIGWGDPAFSNVAAIAPLPGVPTARKVALSRSAQLDDITTDKINMRATAPAALRYADIPPLPDTRDELLAIANTLRADATSDVILGASATRDSVMASSKNGTLVSRRVVAFATHGLMAGDLPNLSQPALALAAGNADAANPLSPLLTLEDVLTLKLNADWVVLSACNTAAADGQAEEALSGLARGFFYAGARSLLVTHWAVDSQSATALTTATFEHYISNPQAPKAESLRQAMLKVMATPTFAHPAYWAPYALVGDGGR